MGGEEDKPLMFFPGLTQMRQGSTAAHAYSLPGFPPQVHLPLLPGAYPAPPSRGAYTYAGPGYAFAQANAYAYPPPPPGPHPYAYPPQGYPHPGSPAPPQQGHGSSVHGVGRQMEEKLKGGGASARAAYGGIGNCHGSSGGHSGGRQVEVIESTSKAGDTAAATASATAAYGGIGHRSCGHGGRRQVEVTETTPPKAAASASASVYGALDKLSRGHGSKNGAFGFFGNCCGGHRGMSFKHADDHGHQGKFKRGRRPAKVEHVHGKFRAKSTTWKY